MGGDALISFECLMADSGRRVAIDAVGLRRIAPKAGFLGFEDTDYQKHFETLYSSLLERLGDKLSKDLPAM